MRGVRRWVAAALIGLGVVAPAASAAGVAYVGGDKEIWVASLDGAQKLRLSGGEGDWLAAAQSDTGWVVGVRNIPGKISTLSTFKVWNASGVQVYGGPLAGNTGDVYPLSLDLTADGRGILYGFSRYIYGFPVGTLTEGYYFLPSETVVAPALGPVAQTGWRWPTFGPGERVVATSDEATIGVQDTGGYLSPNFAPWPGLNATGVAGGKLHRTDVAANGRVLAMEIPVDAGTATSDEKIAMIPVPSLLGTSTPGDCFLPVTGKARNPSLSQDATSVAWSDAGGVKVGGVPDFSGAEPCTLTRPAVVIDPAGTSPSLGAIDVGAILASRTTAPPTASGPAAGAKLVGRSVTLAAAATATPTRPGRCPARATVTVTAGAGLRAVRSLRVRKVTVKGKATCRVTGAVRLSRVPAKGAKVTVRIAGAGLKARTFTATR